MYESCAAAGITPVACTLTPVKSGYLVGESAQADALNASVDMLNRRIASYCSANGVALVDFNAVVQVDPSSYLQPDGIHPSQAGHDAMGRSIDLDALGIAR
jgi:lysophospholipase L1-like esterase